MTALSQFTNFFDQPSMPPPRVPPFTAASLQGQPTSQPRPSPYSPPFRFIGSDMESQQLPPDFGIPELEMECASTLRAIDCFVEEQVRLLEYPDSPGGAGELQNDQREGQRLALRQDPALAELERVYVIENRAEVTEFIKRNRVRGLLIEAREPLIAAFGKGAVKRLSLLDDDEGFTTLFCLVLVPGDIAEARLALESFDQHWWLAHSGQTDGKLNFDFELI